VTDLLTATRAGWARYSAPRVEVAVRFEPTDTGRLAAVEFAVFGDLREVPATARLEAWANGPGRERMMGGLEYRYTAGPGREHVDAGERTEALRRFQWGMGPQAEAEQDAALALVVEPGPGDEFYAEVARAYGEAAVVSASPATAVANANGVCRDKVYGWVKEARRRGLMPAARKGAAA
jgi:hypothetical protein